MNNQILILFAFSLFFQNCTKSKEEPIPSPPPVELEDTLQLLSSTLISNDSSHYFIKSIHLREKGLVLHYYDPLESDTIKAYDLEDLVLNWQFSHRVNSYGIDHCTENYFYYATSWNDRHKIDLSTGIDIWQYYSPEDAIRHRLHVIGDYAYNAFDYGSRQELRRTNIHLDNINWETVYEQTDTTVDRGDFGYTTQWVNNNEDTILVLQSRLLRNVNQGNSDLISYNMTTKEKLWQVNDLTGEVNANSSVLSPLVIDNVIIYANFKEIFGFNKYSGEKLWEFPIPEQVLITSFLSVNGKVIVKPANGGATYAINPQTGGLIWKNEDTGRAKNSIYPYQNKLYITSQSGQLIILDTDTGEELSRFHSPYNRQGFEDKRPHTIYDADLAGPIAIDSINNLLYVSDGYYLMKCKLPE